MDIFTTQLTRVVPVQIKPANLKVKALVKESATAKLTDDPQHLENHDYIVSSKEEASSKHQPEHNDNSDEKQSLLDNENSDKKEIDASSKKQSQPPHLDIFV